MQTENTSGHGEQMQSESSNTNNNGYDKVTKRLALVATILAAVILPNAVWQAVNRVRKMIKEGFSVKTAMNFTIELGLLVCGCVIFFGVMPAMRKRMPRNASNQ